MSERVYALIGSWDWDGTDTHKGLTLCHWNETDGELQAVDHILDAAKIGFTPVMGQNHVYYTVEETKVSDGRKVGGGGYVLAVKIEEGKLRLISRVPSLSTNPSCCAVDESGRYLVVVHHTSGRNTATKICRTEDGRLTNTVVHDDAAIVLFTLHEDGSIGEPVDYAVPDDIGDRKPYLHSVYRIPDTQIFIICDKGLDRIYTYGIENDRLVKLDTVCSENGTSPRYAAFHPHRRIVYAVNEAKAQVGTYAYDPDNGKIHRLAVTELVEDGAKGMPSDLIVTPDGKYLYAIVRLCDRIAVCKINEEGIPVFREWVDCGGGHARGIQIDRNGKYLYSCNMEGDVVTQFLIQDDGSLRKVKDHAIERPANMTIVYD